MGNVLQKNKIFSVDGQDIAQNCTTMAVVTMQFWAAISLQPFVRKFETAIAALKKGKSARS